MSDIGSDKYREYKAKKKREIIPLSSLERAAIQAFADFQLKELCRHEDDCDRIREDLEKIRDRYGVIANPTYIDKWIDCHERTGNGLK